MLDCKVPEDQPIIDRLPSILDHLCEPCAPHFAAVQSYLRDRGIEFEVRPRLVRGLDYYMRTTFEVVHGALGAQNSVLGGGRYDGLAESLGSNVHCAGDRIFDRRRPPGDERRPDRQTPALDLFLAPLGDAAVRHAGDLARELRRAGVSVEVLAGGKLKRAMELANKAGRALCADSGRRRNCSRASTRSKNMQTGEQRRVTREELLPTDRKQELNMQTDERTCARFSWRSSAHAYVRRTARGRRGQHALLMGWVHRRRDLGGVIFIHLRDREGITQLVYPATTRMRRCKAEADLVRSEYVIAVEGVVELRGEGHHQSRLLATGEVELVVDKIWILNESRTPPFPMEDAVDVSEDVRLKYRYVDLRRPRMQRNIIMRSKIAFAVRQYLDSRRVSSKSKRRS